MNTLDARLAKLEKLQPDNKYCYVMYMDVPEEERNGYGDWSYTEADALIKHQEFCSYKHSLGDGSYSVTVIHFIDKKPDDNQNDNHLI